MKNTTSVVVHGDLSSRRRIKAYFSGESFQFIETCTENELLGIVHEQSPSLVIIALSSEDVDIAEEIRRFDREIPIVLITPAITEMLAVAAIRAGVNDCLKEPFSTGEIVQSVRRCLHALPPGQADLKAHFPASSLMGAERMIGRGLLMSEIKTYISKVAQTDTNVLVTGETGTGKELVAELIHSNSPRSRSPFVTFNCAAIPDELLESELFGYEKGAFTGANIQNAGKLKHADGGTVFFDEIGDMSSSAQAKILRAIESKSVYRLGGNNRIPLDIRVIAATNQDLESRVAEGKFRKDLYYRLNVSRIHLPALRDRKEDIPDLLNYYLREFSRNRNGEALSFAEEVFEKLLSYDWPGNIRELKNLLEAILINSPRQTIFTQDLPEQYRKIFWNGEKMPQVELERLVSALFSTNWNKTMAAEKLNWSRMTLYRKMAKYRLVRGGAELINSKCNTGPGDDTDLLHPGRDS